ncbi:MAG: UvrD-helicase domain-containing protein [Alphaproteobacteria bacterium]|nr:UvrD-helicase domain-containing protein [Alphaproteobacteria bacterium]
MTISNSLPSIHEGGSNHFEGLNLAQQQAVTAIDGPVLVLAGAGTGKTRVLTTRLAHLLQSGKALPGQIMAVTFTNKAAAEIRERVSALLGRSVEGWHLGTFHALAARLLRPYAERVGLKPSFTILGTDDQLRLIKQLLEAENIDDKKSPPRVVLGAIERWKDRGLLPEDVGHETSEMANGKVPKLYAQYQQRLRDLNACDFGDLLLHHLTLMRKHPDVLEQIQNRFQYLLVDEYQDTNVAQYLWLRLIAQKSKNICVVGDEDQSIYGWRGAEIGNILRFEEDFPGATVIRLEENYRSTGHILAAASALIAHNEMRLGKTLWTTAEMGDKVHVRTLWDGEEEARWVADEIESLQRRGISLATIAIMVRAGFQTRQFEERFISLGIPYRVLVGARFYERQEIRDALAYLRLIASPDDDLAFERIVNLPKRGVGPAAIQQLYAYAKTNAISLCESALRLSETDELKPKLRITIQTFTQNLMRWRGLLDAIPHAEVAQMALDESGYTGMWQADKSPDAPARLDNLKELISAMSGFDTLAAFLEHVSLVLEVTDKNSGDQVSLMTLHGAKGLEFNYVFLPGWEEEIFPSRMSLSELGTRGLEEERRLAYVGITRARVRAWISHVANRFIYGNWVNALPSRFINELPEENIERFSTVSGNSSSGHRSAHLGGWDEGRPEKIAPLWQQIKASQQRSSSGLSSAKNIQIEGKLREITPPPSMKREGKVNVGDRIMHATFGTGTVRRIDHDKLEIQFDKAGLKKVMESFVKAI